MGGTQDVERPAGGLELIDVHKVYGQGGVAVHALRGVTLRVAPGEMLAVMGPSGSGKSTLMNIIGCLDRPTSGIYRIAGEEVGVKTDDELARLRNRRLGFVFQNYNLLPQLTALQNVELPLVYQGVRPARRREAALRALRAVGLEHRLHHRPAELSGGQQQRVAVARAIVTEPDVILADEPTGSLDSASGAEILAMFQALHRAGRTLVLVTHSEEVALHCERIVRLQDGRVVNDEPVPADRRRRAAPPGGDAA
ncbi:MAG: ABC transporter ATP-binding protein [Firmicutes bacterium]|nr:ABC transporter ATP-binding protein [Bacillota bacterium]